MKASKRSAVGRAYRPTSRVIAPFKTLVSPKDKDTLENKSGAIYWFQCGDLVFYEEYIGDAPSTFVERFKEHLKEASPIHNHSCSTGHTTTQENFQIIRREDHGTAITIKESNTSGLKTKMCSQDIGHANVSEKTFVWACA